MVGLSQLPRRRLASNTSSQATPPNVSTPNPVVRIIFGAVQLDFAVEPVLVVGKGVGLGEGIMVCPSDGVSSGVGVGVGSVVEPVDSLVLQLLL